MSDGSPTVPDARGLPGAADGFERLWTPHRMVYVKGDRPAAEQGADCPFCAAPGLPDEDSLVVHRGEHCYVVLNLFPYNPGHLLICPYRHVPLYVDLTEEERAEIALVAEDEDDARHQGTGSPE